MNGMMEEQEQHGDEWGVMGEYGMGEHGMGHGMGEYGMGEHGMMGHGMSEEEAAWLEEQMGGAQMHGMQQGMEYGMRGIEHGMEHGIHLTDEARAGDGGEMGGGEMGGGELGGDGGALVGAFGCVSDSMSASKAPPPFIETTFTTRAAYESWVRAGALDTHLPPAVPQPPTPPSEALRRLRIDHLVYGYPGSLEAAMDAFEERTGVAPAVGGRHADLGTHNALVAIGDGMYFELLCRDPSQPAPPKLWMGVESMGDTPSMLTWAVDRAGAMPSAVAAARTKGYDPGDVEAFSRLKPDGTTLKWSLAYRHYTREQMGDGGGVVPFLIDWHASVSPAHTAPNGCVLVGLRAEACDVPAVALRLSALGIEPADLGLCAGARDRLVATLRTPKGDVEFG